MANYGQSSVKISVSTASGSAANKDMSDHIDTFNGVSINMITQQSDAFGDSWQEHLPVGVRFMDPLVFEGFYDDAGTSGPHAIWGNTSDVGADRVYEIDFGSSDVVNGHVLITKYERIASRNALTRFRVTMQPSGAQGTAT